MKKINQNLLYLFGIIALVLLSGSLFTQNDPKGIGRMILYLVGAFIFSIAGLITVVLIIANKIKVENFCFLISMIGNLLFTFVFASEIDIEDRNVLIIVFGIPILIGIIELIVLINKEKTTLTNNI